MNIKFNYLYRDAGNYKTYGFVVFQNPDKLQIDQIEPILRSKLIDEVFFDPKILGVPALSHSEFSYSSEMDHSWNEFESLEETDENAVDNRRIDELLLVAKHIALNR
jgi:hypothetical protein